MAAYHWLQVTCGLTAYTLGSALGQTLSNKYEKTLPITDKRKITQPYTCIFLFNDTKEYERFYKNIIYIRENAHV